VFGAEWPAPSTDHVRQAAEHLRYVRSPSYCLRHSLTRARLRRALYGEKVPAKSNSKTLVESLISLIISQSSYIEFTRKAIANLAEKYESQWERLVQAPQEDIEAAIYCSGLAQYKVWSSRR